MAGYFFTSVVSHFHRGTVVLLSPSAPPTSETLCDVLGHTHASWAAVAPSTVEGLGRNPDMLRVVSDKLSRIAFLGGNPSLAMGNEVFWKLNICNLIGSSECGGFAQLILEDDSGEMELWSYIHIHPQTGPVFRRHSPGLCELVIRLDPSCEPYQPVFAPPRDVREFRTSDLFSAHPTIPGFWRHTGRVDDIIVFSNGEKTNPISFESHVAGHPAVSGALVFGTNRTEAGLLVEVAAARDGPPLPSKRELIDLVWPRIEEANALAPAYARIDDSLIGVVTPEKPMTRTAKGTIKRQDTLLSYSQEIEALYNEAEVAGGLPADLVVDTGDVRRLREVIRLVFTNVMKRDAPSDEADFFVVVGMDSLQVIRMVRQLRGALRCPSIEARVVYGNPSVDALAKGLQHAVSNGRAGSTDDSLDMLKQVLGEYRDKVGQLRLPAVNGTAHGSSDGRRQDTVLLTGTTGYVGSYILDQLLKHPSSPTIVCLNRSEDASEVQISRNKR